MADCRAACRGIIPPLPWQTSAPPFSDTARIAELAEASEAAEDAFVDALNRAPSHLETEEQISGEAAHLAALDRFADEDETEDDEEPQH